MYDSRDSSKQVFYISKDMEMTFFSIKINLLAIKM